MSFEEYLKAKKINAPRFEAEEPSRYVALRQLFEVSHPESFTMQKMFLINPIRRKYPL